MNTEEGLDKYLVVINKSKRLTPEKEAWLEENFEYVPYVDEDGESRMEAETFKAYTALVELMKKKYHIDVVSHSAWRSVETQEKVYRDLEKKYDEAWMKSHVALPRESEHHTGLAFDLRFELPMVPESLESKASSVSKAIGLQKIVFKIIEKEAVQFGIIKRYHKNKVNKTKVENEDWHFRYVGVEHAKAMYKANLCLEEYTELLKLNNQNKKVTTR